MDKIKKILRSQENQLAKGITTGDLSANGTTGTMTVRQDLDPVITDLTNRNTPFRDAVRREPGQGEAFTFNTYDSLFGGSEDSNPREAFYADGGLPEEKTTEYGTKVVSYKSLGYKGSVTGLAQAQAQSLVDLYASEVQKTTQRVIQSEEWLAFWSDTTTANTNGEYGFPGLDELITTNVVDAGGAAISKSLIDQATEKIAQRGGTATHLFTSIRVGINIDNIFNQYAQVVINQNDRDNLRLGNKVRDISTVAGVLSLTPDFFLNPGNTYPLPNGTSSFPSGATTSTVFILAMPYISMKDLKPLGMEELGRTADKRDFYVNEYTGLKLTAEPWCAKITNVSDTIS